MSISEYFERLGAPLANVRWSWGAIRPDDGAVILRVWQDRKIVKDGTPIYMVTHHSKYVGNEDSLGYQERLEQVELVRRGAPCYLILCIVADAEASPRKIKSFISTDVFVGGDLVEMNGDTWVSAAKRVPWKDVVI